MKATEHIQNTAKSGEKKRNLENQSHPKYYLPEARRLVEMPFIKPTFAKITKIPQNKNSKHS